MAATTAIAAPVMGPPATLRAREPSDRASERTCAGCSWRARASRRPRRQSDQMPTAPRTSRSRESSSRRTRQAGRVQGGACDESEPRREDRPCRRGRHPPPRGYRERETNRAEDPAGTQNTRLPTQIPTLRRLRRSRSRRSRHAGSSDTRVADLAHEQRNHRPSPHDPAPDALTDQARSRPSPARFSRMPARRRET